MSMVDWSKAPEDATHYGPATPDWNACWMKKVGGEWHGWLAKYDTKWGYLASATNDRARIASLIERPKQPQAWSGPEDGLPPVGQEFMFKVKGIHQGIGFVSFYGEEFCVIKNTTNDGGPAEQVCKICDLSVITDSERRDAAIADMYSVCQAYRESMLDAFFGKLYDAGFKREVV